MSTQLAWVICVALVCVAGNVALVLWRSCLGRSLERQVEALGARVQALSDSVDHKLSSDESTSRKLQEQVEALRVELDALTAQLAARRL